MGEQDAWWRNPGLYRYWLPPLLWCAGVLALSGDWGSSQNSLGLLRWLLSWFTWLSHSQIVVINSYLRKVGHVLAYAGLYFFWFRAFQGNLYYSPKKSFLWALGLSLLVSLVDEGHQSLFLTRRGGLQDVGLDFSASLLAACLTALFWPTRTRPGPAPGELAAGQPADR
jgi:VanZ family protein